MVFVVESLTSGLLQRERVARSALVVVAAAQLCPTLGTPWTVCSPPGSSLHGISQALLCWEASPKRGVRQPHLGARN